MRNDVISLNEKLFNEFSVEELEDRLETDPLLFTSLFTGMVENDANADIAGCECNKLTICDVLDTCTIYCFLYEGIIR